MRLAVNVPAKCVSGHRLGNARVRSNRAFSVSFLEAELAEWLRYKPRQVKSVTITKTNIHRRSTRSILSFLHSSFLLVSAFSFFFPFPSFFAHSSFLSNRVSFFGKMSKFSKKRKKEKNFAFRYFLYAQTSHSSQKEGTSFIIIIIRER